MTSHDALKEILEKVQALPGRLLAAMQESGARHSPLPGERQIAQPEAEGGEREAESDERKENERKPLPEAKREPEQPEVKALPEPKREPKQPLKEPHRFRDFAEGLMGRHIPALHPQKPKKLPSPAHRESSLPGRESNQGQEKVINLLERIADGIDDLVEAAHHKGGPVSRSKRPTRSLAGGETQNFAQASPSAPTIVKHGARGMGNRQKQASETIGRAKQQFESRKSSMPSVQASPRGGAAAGEAAAGAESLKGAEVASLIAGT